ncbi:hypothetical protein [Pseudomonas viridiflava]|uniref:hypothetical protein n=1 Tax=Pseudomonas viridiflava TaxID=33069 RepID=UPI000F04372A|nr:hypothetical protein [Pseudomonas viridiflava]
MPITPDLFKQYVNREQFDLARSSLDQMREDGHSFLGFSSTNTMIPLIKLALNSKNLTIPPPMLSHCFMAPGFNQLKTCLSLESRKYLEGREVDQELIDHVCAVCLDIIKAASEGAPESLRNQTLNAHVEKLLLHANFPRAVGMKGEAFKPYRDLYFGADLGL